MSILRSLDKYGYRWPVFVALRISQHLRVVTRLRCIFFNIIADFRTGGGVNLGSGIRITPLCKIVLGRNVHVGHGCTLEVGPDAELQIGDRTWISHHCHVEANAGLVIGRDVLVGEFVSIRDTTHSYASSLLPVRDQGDRICKIVIGDDVWIGRGAAIISNGRVLTIGSGCIIGANAVITRSIPPNSIWVGARATLLKYRRNMATGTEHSISGDNSVGDVDG